MPQFSHTSRTLCWYSS